MKNFNSDLFLCQLFILILLKVQYKINYGNGNSFKYAGQKNIMRITMSYFKKIHFIKKLCIRRQYSDYDFSATPNTVFSLIDNYHLLYAGYWYEQ